MSASNESQCDTRTISPRTWRQWLRRELKSAVILTVIAAGGLLLLIWAINPSDVNHFVIINQSGHDIKNLVVTLQMDGDRQATIHDGYCGDGVVRVVNWPSPFGRPWWIAVTADAVVHDRIALLSHGRYYHSIVVMLDAQGKVRVESDRMPKDDQIP